MKKPGCICICEYDPPRSTCPVHGEPEYFIDIDTRLERLASAQKRLQDLKSKIFSAQDSPGDNEKIRRAIMALRQIRFDIDAALRCAAEFGP